MRYNLGVAYVLWLLSGCGILGVQRFYLGKVGTGILWICTGGMCGIGAFYDLLTLPKQVREANVKYEVEARVRGELGYASPPPPKPEDREKNILRVARSNGGFVSPGEAALEGDMSVDEARKLLEKMASNGTAQMRVRSSGVVVYFFPEFAKEGRDDFVV